MHIRKVLDTPIPTFNSADTPHRRLHSKPMRRSRRALQVKWL